jgi:hypothetical protein
MIPNHRAWEPTAYKFNPISNFIQDLFGQYESLFTKIDVKVIRDCLVRKIVKAQE